jgi:hypothetical protein
MLRLTGDNAVQDHSKWQLQKRLLGFLAGVLAVAAAVPSCANGETVQTYTVGTETIPVAERAHEGYEAVGIEAGGFTILPAVDTAVAYDTNVNAVAVNKRADGYFSFTPVVNIRSDWSSNQLDLHADYGTHRYFTIPINDFDQYGVSLNGLLDISRDTHLTASGSIGKRVEPRGTEGDTLSNGPPVSYRLITTETELVQDLGRVQAQFTGNYAQYHYNDDVIAGVPIDLTFRNNSSYSEEARINYGLSPRISLYVEGSLNQSRYSVKVAGVDRDSHGIQALSGVTFDVTALLSGQIGIGYIQQSFNSPEFPKVSGFDYNAQVTWNVTTLSTLTFRADRSIQRSPLAGIAGIIASNFGVVLDHELRRNILLRGGVAYSSNAYDGTSQVNHRLGLNASVRYLLNRHITLGLADNYTRQRQGGVVVSETSYTRNQIILSLTFGL